MLTYTPPSKNQVTTTHEKPWLLVMLVFAWLWLGVFSHDLWNPSEPAVYTAIEAFSNGGDAWLPRVFEKIDFSISPVYVWVASIFRWLLSSWLTDAYSASRFASVFFTAIGLTCGGLAGYKFLGRHQGRSVVLILIGCVGLLPFTHFLGSLSVTFAALAMCLYGFSLVKTRVIMSALQLGIGWSLLSLSQGFLLPTAFMLMAIILPLSKTWQFRRYYIVLLGTFTFAIPLMLIYPYALYRTDDAVYQIWLTRYLWGSFGGIENFRVSFSLFYYLKNLIWFAFPAWALAIWTSTREKLMQQDWGVLSLAWLTIIGILLILNPHQFQDNLIWLLLPLALLGAAQLDGLRRGTAAFINWFGIMTFGLLAIFLWLGFFAMNFGWPVKLAERSAYFSPYYVPSINIIPTVVALLFTLMWFWAITRKHVRGRQAVTNWAAGVTLVWALLMTLFLPWLNAAKSYAPVVQRMQAAIPLYVQQDIANGRRCINVAEQAITARIAWAQYGALPVKVNNQVCEYELLELPLNSKVAADSELIWQGTRPRNKSEGFILLQKPTQKD